MLKKCHLTDRWPAASFGEVTIHIDNREAKLTLSSLNVRPRPKFIIKGIAKNLMSPPPLAR